MKKQQYLKEEPAMRSKIRKVLSAALAALRLLRGLALPTAAAELSHEGARGFSSVIYAKSRE